MLGIGPVSLLAAVVFAVPSAAFASLMALRFQSRRLMAGKFPWGPVFFAAAAAALAGGVTFAILVSALGLIGPNAAPFILLFAGAGAMTWALFSFPMTGCGVAVAVWVLRRWNDR